MLYIMRYGKTDWNVQHKLQGRIDIPNNEKIYEKCTKYICETILICYNITTRCVNNYTTTFSG